MGYLPEKSKIQTPNVVTSNIGLDKRRTIFSNKGLYKYKVFKKPALNGNTMSKEVFGKLR